MIWATRVARASLPMIQAARTVTMITVLRPCALSPATSAVDPAIHPLTRRRAFFTMPRSRGREVVASPPGLLGDLQPFPPASRWRGRALPRWRVCPLAVSSSPEIGAWATRGDPGLRTPHRSINRTLPTRGHSLTCRCRFGAVLLPAKIAICHNMIALSAQACSGTASVITGRKTRLPPRSDQ